jgi:hypothetical protein
MQFNASTFGILADCRPGGILSRYIAGNLSHRSAVNCLDAAPVKPA